MKAIYLHKGKEISLKRFHPWVFSGAIKTKEGEPVEGEVVKVFSSSKEFLGIGHYANGSIAIRIFSFDDKNIDQDFWNSKMEEAYVYRAKIGIVGNPNLNTFRLIFAEGDGLPGLIIDIYNDVAVLQAHSLGMYLQRENISLALQQVLGKKLKAVFDKSAETLGGAHGIEFKNEYIFGDHQGDCWVNEYGNHFNIDWLAGQKTGFFIDQRENRKLVSQYVKDKSVLNTFCYTGGFSVYALNAGAKLVHSVDSSKKAIDLCDKNIAKALNPELHQSFAMDVFDFFKNTSEVYDVIILDPPAFAKSLRVRHNALMGYKRLNVEAIKRIKKGGILFTYSCSQVVDKYLFQHTITAAAIEAGRKIRVIDQMTQPADHPFSIFHPEGEYLKGMVLEIT